MRSMKQNSNRLAGYNSGYTSALIAYSAGLLINNPLALSGVERE